MLQLLELGLATWRLSNMLVSERGPWDIFIAIRTTFGIRHYDDGTPANPEPTNVLSCVWCASIWAAMLLLFVPRQVRSVLAASAIAVVMKERVVNGES